MPSVRLNFIMTSVLRGLSENKALKKKGEEDEAW